MKRSVRSWVWQYAERDGDKALCNLCDTYFSSPGGTTGGIGRHLEKIHSITSSCKQNLEILGQETCDQSEVLEEKSHDSAIYQPSTSTITLSDSPEFRPTNPIKRRRIRIVPSEGFRPCNKERTEKINQALAKMIALNQMPISFSSSAGYAHFMSILEPNYQPCKEGAVLKRLQSLYKNSSELLKQELRAVESISCTTDCWTSCAQDSYITITVHFINEQWEPKQYTLTTHELMERHTAINLAETIQNSLNFWEIESKTVAIITDNAANMVNAVQYLGTPAELTCAAHSIQLAVGKAILESRVEKILQKVSAIVGHFKHSVIAKQALKRKQEQLGQNVETLIQSCKTRWNSVYSMLERLLENRIPVTSVLADRNVTSMSMAQKLEIVETEWADIEKVLVLLKPLQALTTVLCSDKHSPVSIVRPLIQATVLKHYGHNAKEDGFINNVKHCIRTELIERFHLENDYSSDHVSIRQLASFLDPRYKDLEYEEGLVRIKIREHVKMQLKSNFSVREENECSNNVDTHITKVNNRSRDHLNALAFIFQEETSNPEDINGQLNSYLSEQKLRFDQDPYEWWKARQDKYPDIATLARKYLAVPATSASSERCFSTAGNIITSKRSCLLPENASMLIFLFQNRHLLLK